MTAQAVTYGGIRTGSLWLTLTAGTIFLAAFLLFQVELLIAKMILPWFGGSAAVWLACLLFFQLALLCGYLYAHLVATRLTPLMQARVHSILVIASLALLPIIPSEFWKPTGAENPLPLILGLLGSTIGLPFLLLSSSTPLLQAWMVRASAGRLGAGPSIYRLYALSNLGSMLSLLSYPLVVEPLLAIHLQAWIWSAAYIVFAGLSIAAAWRQSAATGEVAPSQPASDSVSLKISDRVFWVLLPAAASALLLAVSNHILRNVAAIPLFWVIPLALYLLSFIVAFDHPRWYFRPVWLAAFTLAAGVMSRVLVGLIQPDDLRLLLGIYTVGLFVLCMVCHGELARLKPAARHLTAYYLSISAGGAAGGLLVAALAPVLLPVDIDLALILPLTALLIIAAAWRSLPPETDSRSITARRIMLGGSLLIFGDFTGTMAAREYADVTHQVHVERNFYGPLRVDDIGGIRRLWNGNIVHGTEYLAPLLASEPMSYYTRSSGLGMALTELGLDRPLHVGAIGLGSGTIAAYARPGDVFNFYEINPAVPEIAKTYFHYFDACGGECDIALGDARLSLEREAPQGFDLLAVDAFSSDAIPAHLLTREAFALYWRHLKPGGVLAIHTTNRYVSLPPVVALAAQLDEKTARSIISFGDTGAANYSEWVLVTADPAFFDKPLLGGTRITIPAGLSPWTDDYSNLWQLLRSGRQ